MLAEVACAAGFLAEMVVADEEEGGVAVVEHVADDVDNLGGDVDAAVGHEMVDVVDDDEVGLLLLDEGLNGSVDVPEVVTLATEDVEADEVEVLLVDGMGC